jgi:hypothetical protein
LLRTDEAGHEGEDQGTAWNSLHARA